jgi:hypothetical protein
VANQDEAAETARSPCNQIAPLYHLMESLVERSRYRKWRELLWGKVNFLGILDGSS